MKKRKIPMRMCIGCREMKPKKELIRIVRSPEGDIDIDFKGKAPGRGAYLCFSQMCMNKAEKSKMLEKAFGQKIDQEIYEKLRMRLNEGEIN
ncbi:MAG: YlxR family protein [Clostridiales bacterium]|nr:YlxR family protein [Clostridiales bacterium]